MKKRILLIDNSPDVTGAFRSILSHAIALSGEFKFHFAVTRNSRTVLELKRNSFPFIELPFSEIRKSWSVLAYGPMLLYNVLELRKYARLHGIQIIHVNDMYNMGGVLLKTICPDLKLVYHIRLLRSSYIRFLHQTWLRLIKMKADRIVVVSEAAGNRVTGTINGLALDLISDFLPLEGQVDHVESPGPLRFLFPANYIPGKGHLMAIMAFSEVLRSRQDIRLTFTGGDLGMRKNRRFRDSLLKEIVSRDLGNVVRVEGAYDNIRTVLANADVVLMFSESESFSMVCYESMYYGFPVVATRCGGPEEFIIDGVSGILVNNRDVSSMRRAIERISDDPELRIRLGRQAALDMQRRIREAGASKALGNVYGEL